MQSRSLETPRRVTLTPSVVFAHGVTTFQARVQGPDFGHGVRKEPAG